MENTKIIESMVDICDNFRIQLKLDKDEAIGQLTNYLSLMKGWIYLNHGKLDDAISHSHRAYSYAKEINQRQCLSNLYVPIAEAHLLRNNLDEVESEIDFLITTEQIRLPNIVKCMTLKVLFLKKEENLKKLKNISEKQ